MSAIAEASDLILQIAGPVRSTKERRLVAWRAVAAKFTFNRICDLDRKERRASVSGDELNWLRAAAEEKDRARRAAARKQDEAESELAQKYREIIERIARLESRLGTRWEDMAG